MGEDTYLGGSNPGMVGALRDALGIHRQPDLGLVEFDPGELEFDTSYVSEPQTQADLIDAAVYEMKKGLGPASQDLATEAKIKFLAAWGAQQAQEAQSADDVIRFILALDENPQKNPHGLVTRLFAAAQRAKAYTMRTKNRPT